MKNIVMVSDSHLNLYLDSVNNYCRTQQNVVEWLTIYSKIKCNELSDEEVEVLYDDYSEDETEHTPNYEAYGSKKGYLEYELYRLINTSKNNILKDVNISFKRLDVLLGLLI